MASANVEYLGFTAASKSREYRLRVRQGLDIEDFTVAVPNEAFLAHRVRYQDGPEICFLKLQRAVAAGEGVLPKRALSVTDAELEEYRVAHTPKTLRRS
jgi:hypothetical protein